MSALEKEEKAQGQLDREKPGAAVQPKRKVPAPKRKVPAPKQDRGSGVPSATGDQGRV